MALNATDFELEEEKKKKMEALVPKLWIYVIEGTILTIANGLILAAVLRHKALRRKKEYIVVAGLALVDGMNGFATFLAILRIKSIVDGVAHELVSRWYCLTTPWNHIYIWSDPLQAIMLMVVSIDRLIAVSLPLKYFKYTPTYSFILVGSAYGFMAVVVLVGYITSYQYQSPEKARICFTSYRLNEQFYRFHNYIRIVPAFLSIVIYVAVVFMFNRKKPVAPSGGENSASAHHLKAQRKLTKTLGISSFFTLIFYVIPMAVEVVMSYVDMSSDMLATIIPYTFTINNLNPMMNFFIYTARHKDMRHAVVCLFLCKELTPMMLGTHSIHVSVKQTAPKEKTNG